MLPADVCETVGVFMWFMGMLLFLAGRMLLAVFVGRQNAVGYGKVERCRYLDVLSIAIHKCYGVAEIFHHRSVVGEAVGIVLTVSAFEQVVPNVCGVCTSR